MKALLLLLSAACACCSQAVEVSQVEANKSQIAFTSTQMGVPVKGGFRKFAAKINFDSANAAAGKISVDVDLGSIDAGSNEANSEVKGKGWLDIAAFPKASFVSDSIKSLGGARFEARGPLVIKGISRNIVVPFALRLDAAGSWLEGGFVLPRLQFKIGEGEWSDTSVVANEVQVKFALFRTNKK